MRLLRSVPLLLAAAVVLLAQSASPVDEKPASLSGSVTNSVTGEPILRAHVSLRRSSQNQQQAYGALSNGEGKFTVGPLPPGDYLMVVERVGFFAPISGTGRNSQVKLAAGDRKDGLKLTLTPVGAITGRVLNADGEPVAGAMVFAEGGSEPKGATSDEKGQFRIGGLRAGRYRIKATPQSLPLPVEMRDNGKRDSHDSATYYPSSLMAAGGQRLEVKPAAEISGADIRLVRVAAVKVSGRVTGLPPEAKNVTIQLQSRDGGSSMARAKADRTFELWNVDPGKSTLSVLSYSPTEEPPMLMSAPVEIEVNAGNIENLELQIVRPFAVQGQLRFEDEQARQPLNIIIRESGLPVPPTPSQGRVHLLSEIGRGSPPTDIGSDDSFKIENVQPGIYRMSVEGRSGYVKSVRAGMTETEGETLDLRTGSPGPITVTLSSNTCEISGTVRDLKGPVDGAMVAMMPAVGNMQGHHRTNTDANGAFKFSGVHPGKYRLVSLDDEDVSLTNLEDYQSVIENLDLRAGDKVVKDLRRR